MIEDREAAARLLDTLMSACAELRGLLVGGMGMVADAKEKRTSDCIKTIQNAVQSLTQTCL